MAIMRAHLTPGQQSLLLALLEISENNGFRESPRRERFYDNDTTSPTRMVEGYLL